MSEAAVVSRLIERGRDCTDAESTGNTEADALVGNLEGFPHAFVLACLMDRQGDWKKAWQVPYFISVKLGGFSMEALAELPEEKIREWMSGPPALCYRFNVMSGVFHSAIQRIVTEYGCDASRIWNGRPSSAEVVYRFLQFRGAGPKIATMATNILARDYRVEFSDYSGIDISPDVHVRRVFSCLGLCGGGASEDEVMYRARALHPEYPGILDLPVWTIGTNWCKAKEADRNCASCYMRDLCPSAKPKY